MENDTQRPDSALDYSFSMVINVLVHPEEELSANEKKNNVQEVSNKVK